jgi:hypothetical protein
MKKNKKCFNSVVGVTEPEDCIRERCTAWVKVSGLEGCSFVLDAVTNIINNIKDMEGKDKEKADDIDSTGDTQGEERGTDDIDAGGKEPTVSDTDIENAKEQIEGSEIPKEGVITPIASGEATMKPIDVGDQQSTPMSQIDNGVYKGDPK